MPYDIPLRNKKTREEMPVEKVLGWSLDYENPYKDECGSVHL